MHTRGCAAYSFKHEKFQIAMFANNIEKDQGNLFLQVCRSLAELFPNGRKDVAKKLGISDPHFDKWKNGKLEGENKSYSQEGCGLESVGTKTSSIGSAGAL